MGDRRSEYFLSWRSGKQGSYLCAVFQQSDLRQENFLNDPMTASNQSFLYFQEKGSTKSQLETSLSPTLASPFHISSLLCSLSRWLSLTPTPLGASRRSPAGQEPEEEENCKSQHGGQSSSANLIVEKATSLPPQSTTPGRVPPSMEAEDHLY